MSHENTAPVQHTLLWHESPVVRRVLIDLVHDTPDLRDRIIVSEMASPESVLPETLLIDVHTALANPFTPRQFVQTVIEILARRARQDKRYLAWGGVEMDCYTRTLKQMSQEHTSVGAVLDLTEKEVDVLACLYQAQQPIDKNDLLKSVWGVTHPDIETHTVETHIYRLRQKLMQAGFDDMIETVDAGYCLIREKRV